VAAIGSSAWQVGVKYLMIAKAQTSWIRRIRRVQGSCFSPPPSPLQFVKCSAHTDTHAHTHTRATAGGLSAYNMPQFMRTIGLPRPHNQGGS